MLATRPHRALCLALLLAGAACAAPATPPPAAPSRPAPADAAQVLEEAMAALDELPPVRGVFAHRITTPGGNGDVAFAGTAQMRAAVTGSGNMMRLEGSRQRPDGASARLVITHDGETVSVADVDAGRLRTDSVFRAGTRLFIEQTGSAFFTWLDPSHLQALLASDMSLQAGVDVAGTLCDVLTFPLPRDSHYEMAFGREDRLLRRYRYVTGGEPPSRDEETLFTDLQIGPGADGPFTQDGSGLSVEPYGVGVLSPGDEAPDFMVSAADGTSFSLAGQRGRVVLLDFWATWCGPCKPAMAGLQALADDYADRPLTVIGLTFMQAEDPSSFLREVGVTYPVFSGEQAAPDYGVPVLGLPTLFIIGADGRIVDYSIGYKGEASEAWLRRVVDRALAEAG